MATHAIDDVAAICDYVIILSQSRVVLSEDLDYVLESHRFLSRGLDDGVPVRAEPRCCKNYAPHAR